MRLARPVYESMPLVYAAIGGLAILLAYLDPDGPRAVVAMFIGVAAEIAALTVLHSAHRLRHFRVISAGYGGFEVTSAS
jgi:hypothetical protein